MNSILVRRRVHRACSSAESTSGVVFVVVNAPAKDPARVHVGDEADVAESRDRRHLGEVRDSATVRGGRCEVPIQQVWARPAVLSGIVVRVPLPRTSFQTRKEAAPNRARFNPVGA